ncbi:glycoside hydrolase family 95 protein [Dyadobacter tibetensis]|uniref:glycoside hydrolase family 95 protein n=1 Tax=Dyadobacter tibetensis TaxID=1211851 RepID=UPI000470E11E|nr:glycoside hydrolase family 95 protein [Dyadobacter tibetensis]
MKKLIHTVCLFLGLSSVIMAQEKHHLVYHTPAEKWTEALPIGNGSLGGMVFSGVTQEHIQFNQETLWKGAPHDYAHPGAKTYLSEIRNLLAEGKQIEAQKLASEKFMSVPLQQKAYQPFGDLYIDFEGHENYSNYNRVLDLDNALCRTSYSVGKVKYEREVLASYPDQTIAVELSASQSKSLNFALYLDAPHEEKTIVSKDGTQTLTVKVKDGVLNGVATLTLKTDGNLKVVDGKLQIRAASQASIYLCAATNYKNFKDVSANPMELVRAQIAKIKSKSFSQVKADHIADYQSLYNRFQISFGTNEKSGLATNERLFAFAKEPNDPQLIALYMQYSRYLTIASSRPGTNPATLQGIWNDKLTPPWFSSYTTNINTEMNYWAVESTNLSECHDPLFKLIEECAQSGSIVAKEHYDARGWVLHHNTDIWRGAAPVNHSNHGIWVTGAAWLSTHIWEYYLYTQDLTFLKEKYPLMRDAALFFTDFLVKDKVTGYLISSPSTSPEIGGLVAGPTMDHEIIRALFKMVVQASEILNQDQALAHDLKKLIPQIQPYQIGKHGQLQEWLQDKDNPDEHHRHVSHLWSVYPGNELNPEETPEFFDAAKQSLMYRGDNGTGWSLAWKINFWARFLDGNRAYRLLHKLLSPAEVPGKPARGGTYPNLFDAHPPFQIDGNFGGTSGVIEMLMQSHLEYINLLPALPDALAQGEVRGLCARGGFELSFQWKNGELSRLEVWSKSGNKCSLKYKGHHLSFDTEKGQKYIFNAELKKL